MQVQSVARAQRMSRSRSQGPAVAASLAHAHTSAWCAGSEGSPRSDAPPTRSTVEVIECWHLSPEQHSVLLSDCLLPLACAHVGAALHAPVLSAPSGTSAATPARPAAGADPC